MRFFPLALTITVALFAIAPIHAAEPLPTPLTAEQNHQSMMDQLHISSLRPGADGFNAQAPNAQNTDEAKANRYSVLPDPLVLKNGRKVTPTKLWWKQRRQEITQDFDAS